MAQIGRNTPNISLTGTDDADLIQNGYDGTNVTIDGLGDNDTLQNWGSTVTINGGAGDDNFYNDAAASNVLINGDDGNDLAQNSGTNVTLNGGAGNDSLQNWGNGVMISGGSDDDNLYNQGTNVQINGDDGNDIAQNNGTNVTVNGGGGKDTLRNFGTIVTISGDADDDYIQNSATDVSINGGKGNDFIANAVDSVTIAGGDDADTIHNDGSKVSIDSGAGNDSIQNAGTNVKIAMKGGKDLINNFAAQVTIDGGDDADTVGNWEGSDNASINGGKGNDSVYNYGNNVTLRGGEGNDEINNVSGNNSLLDGGDGNDSIQNGGTDTTIDGGAGSDTIVNTTAYYRDAAGGIMTVSPDSVTIDGGDDNDFITNDADNVSISGGKGNDSITNDGGSFVTLGGGQGNDTLTGSAKAEVFVYSGGNDVITNYSGEDTVQIAAGNLQTVNVTDGNVVFQIGKGSLTLKDMQGRVITVTDADGNTMTQRYGETGYSAQDVIKNLVKAWTQTSLSDNAKLDEAIKLSTHFNGIQDAVDAMIADCRAAGDADTFLRKYCGIILDNADTGAITGWDAGGDAVINGDDIVGETLATVQQVPDYTNTTFTAGNLTVHLGSSGSTLNADGKKVFDGIYSWWADESVKLIEKSYGVTFSDSDSINIAMVRTASFAGNTRSDGYMRLNQGNVEFADDDDYNGNGIDRTFAHELTHAAQYFLMGGDFPQFLMEGLAELTHGIDERAGKQEYITSLSENPDSLASYLNLDDDGTGNIPYYVAGYMFYRYLARQAALAYDETKDYAFKDGSAINGTDDAELLTGNANNVTISAGGGNDTITAYGSKMLVQGNGGDDSIINNGSGNTLAGGADNDSIFNYAASVSINGGDDIDYVENYGSKVTINGGGGNDTIINDGANNNVASGEGNDFIQSTGSDVTLTGGKDDDTLYNRSGSNVLFRYTEGDGNDLIQGFNATSTLQIVGTYDSSIKSGKNMLIKVGDNVITLAGAMNLSKVNIVEVSNPLDVTGTDEPDSIANSLDDATIKPGGGDDTIVNTGANVLIAYTAGNDLIEGFRADSTLQLGDGSDTYTKAVDDKDVVLTVGDNEITLTGADALDTLNIVGKEIITAVTFTNSDNAKQTLDADIITADASARTKATRIVGNALDNSIVGGSGKDTIYGGKGSDTISGGAGNDKLYGQAGNDLFIYTAGNDIIADFEAGDTLQLGDDGTLSYETVVSGKDVIVTVGDNEITLTGAASLDTLNIVGEEIQPVETLIAFTNSDAAKQTLGADIIVADASARTKAIRIVGNALDNSIVGGSGKDTIYGGDGSDTIAGGKGNDKLYGQAGNDLFLYTAGNDIITDFEAGDTLQLGDDGSLSYETLVSGKDVIVTVGDNEITLTGAASLSTLNILGTEENRTGVEIDGKTARLTDYYLEDSFSIADNLDLTTIDASAVTYDIELVGNKKANSILGGSGNDTLEGGKGNDTLTGGAGSDIFLYSAGDGNDIITDYDAEDIIRVNGIVGKVTPSNGNAILTIGKQKISVMGGASTAVTYTDNTAEFNEKGTAVTLTSDYTADTFDVNTNPQVADYAAKLKTIDASAVTRDLAITGNKNANKIIGGDGNETLIGGAGNDTLTGGKGSDVFVYNSGDGNDLITDYSKEDIVRVNGTVSKSTIIGKNVILTIGSNKISLKGAAGKVITFTDNTAKFNAAGTVVTLTSKYIRDDFDVAKYGDYAGTVKTITASAVTHDLTITGNKLANKIIGGTGNDTLIGGKGNDNLTGGDGSDVFVYNSGDGNDLITDYTEEDKLLINGAISKIATTKGGVVVFHVDGGKVSVKGGTEQLITYVDAKDKEHFYPDEVSFSDDGKQATILSSYQKSAFDITDYGSYGTTVQTINAAVVTHDISITANSKANKIYGSANNDYIDGGAAKDVLYGGEGNDTLYGGTGNDTLWGGDGADVFLYNEGDGNDVIADYAPEDTIRIAAGTVTAVSADGNDALVEFTKGTITVKDAADKILTFEDGGQLISFNVTPSASVNAAGTAVTLKANYVPDTFNITTDGGDYAGKLKTVDASAVIHDIDITGNKLANKIIGSAYNDTLWGGAGNDTLTGGDGSDTFIYTAGKDVITDFDNDDLLQITGTFSGTYNASKNTVAFKVGTTSNAITLKDVTATTFNINGDAYVVTDGKIKRLKD